MISKTMAMATTPTVSEGHKLGATAGKNLAKSREPLQNPTEHLEEITLRDPRRGL